jgi:hypothetical protein
MNVEAAVTRRIQHLLWQDQAIGHDNCHISPKRGEGCLLILPA